MCYRIINGLIDVNFHDFFDFKRGRHLRGHFQKLMVPTFRKNTRKFDFACRVTHSWNSLPEEVINSCTLPGFKRMLNTADLSRFLHYQE